MAPLPDDNDNLPTLALDWNAHHNEKDDVEAVNAIAEDRRREIRQAIRSRHPFLNDKQVELVGTLDDAIDNAVPEVHLPRLKLENFSHRLTCKEFLSKIKVPTLIFLVTAGAAVAVALTDNSFAGTLYPYLITLVTFLASVPAIKSKYEHYYEVTSSKIQVAKRKIEPAIDTLETKATGLVVLARSKLNNFLKSVRVELNQLTRAKRALQTVNSDLEKIPDVSDLEGYLDDQENQIHGSIQNARSAVEPDRFVPWVLKSKRNFNCGILFPILLVMLAIQFFGTWRTEKALEPSDSEWDPVIVASQTYGIAVAEIAFAFFLTRSKRMIGFINRKVKAMNNSVNRLLRNKALDAFHSVLDIAMNHVRERVLQIVNNLRQLECVAKGIQDQAHALENSANQATEAAVLVENTIQDITNVETHEASSLLKTVSEFLSSVVYKIDDWTAGLIDCTGFVDAPEETKTAVS